MIRPQGIDNGAFVVSPIQCGMLVYCSCSSLLLCRTLAPSPSSVPSSQPSSWQPAMILKMVTMIIILIIAIISKNTIIRIITIIDIMCVIAIMHIIAYFYLQAGWNLSAHVFYTSLTTRNLSGTSFPFRVSSASFLWFPSVIPALSRTTCATHFLALPATADRVLAMDAGCGSSTRGLWDGPGTCNDSIRVAAREAAWRKVPSEKLRGEKLNVDALHRHVWAVLSSNLAVL